MHFEVFFILLLCIIGCYSNLKVSIDKTGAYNVTVNDKLWLRSSRTALYADNRWYSTENGSLTLSSITEAQGTDPNLGAWNETLLTYSFAGNQASAPIIAHIRQWSSVSALSFHLETGDQVLENQVVLDYDQIRTVFPSFYIEKIDSNDDRGYFRVGGAMGGFDEIASGLWQASSTVIQSSMIAGPITLFNLTQKGEGDTIVISPFSHFMATSLSHRRKLSDSILEYGIMGSINTIPANYTQSLIVFYSPNGINRAVHDWGTTMQKAFNRTNEHRLNDLTVNYLGYYTNNGGYYYYNTEPDKNYQQTILDVAQFIKLPYHYLQFDSWWYYKASKNGIKEWRARPDVFPDGLPALHRLLSNIPLGAHNRWWDIDNVYKQQYAFALDTATFKALPYANDSFWFDFFLEAHNWGLALYVQDWLSPQTTDFRPLRSDIHLGERWLKSMGEAADKMDINIQYCMSLPRHFLQAVEIPRVTHARASDDYAVSLMNPTKPQWRIGITSMFLDAMGIAPFKDVLWSATVQPGSPYSFNATELLPDRQISIATLSTGPVAFGDGINFTNVQRLMRCCRSDGLILKPDRPITTINEVIADWALNSGALPGELYSTQTTINDCNFYVIFASAMKKDYTIYPAMIEDHDSGIIWSYDNAQVTATFDHTRPLDVSASKCNDASFCLWYVSPLWEFNDAAHTKYALLGEYNKWTVVSRQRFVSITTNTEKTQTTVAVQGVASEPVSIVVYHSTLHTQTVNCQLSAAGQANLIITPTTTTCS